MAIALKNRIRDLLSEFLTDALILLCPFQTTGTVAAGAFQTVFDHLDQLFVIVQLYSQKNHFPFSFQYNFSV